MSDRMEQRGLQSLPELWPWGALALLFAVLAISVGVSGRVPYPPPALVLALVVLALVTVVILGADRARRVVPAGCLAGAIVLSGLSGGLGMHLVPVFAVLCAGLLLAATTGQAPRLRWLLPAAATAGVLSLVFASVVIRPRPDSGDSSASDLTSERASGSASNSDGPQSATIERLVDAVRRAFGLGDDDQPPGAEELPGGAARLGEPDDPTNWWLLLAMLVVLIALALMVWLLVRWLARRSARSAGAGTWPLIERFEAIGAQAGRRRRPEQGLVDYGEGLSGRDDRRPHDVGASLSGLLYDPTAGDETTAEHMLIDLESRPPAPALSKPQTRWRRLLRRIRA